MYFLINPLSGGRQGVPLARVLEKRFGHEHVFNVLSDPSSHVFACARQEKVPVIVAGGDGTVAAILDEQLEHGYGDVPVGVIPLGTGNDCARYLGIKSWRLSDIDSVLAILSEQVPQRMDRWKLVGPASTHIWYNYCSFGADARVALQFDQLRKMHRPFFSKAWLNKAWYGLLGMLHPNRMLPLASEHALKGVQSLVCTNIPSYAGGSLLHRSIQADDGCFEVLGLPGGLAMGSRLAGQRQAHLYEQTTSWNFSLTRSCAMQVDGEPFIAESGQYTISACEPALVLGKSASKVGSYL